MTPEQLDAIEARANAATPGPWTPSHHPNDPYHWAVFDTDTRALTANRGGCPDDAEFIAAARTDIPVLVAEIRRLWTQMDVACGAVDAVVSVLERFRDEEDHDA